MAKPTEERIAEEIETLKEQVKTVRKSSAFGDDNRAAINAQIRTLEEGFDEDDIEDFIDDDQQQDARDAFYWVNGDEDVSPSASWAPLCKSREG